MRCSGTILLYFYHSDWYITFSFAHFKKNIGASIEFEFQCKTLTLLDDPDSRKVDQLLETLERIDDDCAVRGIHFVKVAQDDKDENNDVFGIDKLPKLVYFNDKLPNMYEGRMYTIHLYTPICGQCEEIS